MSLVIVIIATVVLFSFLILFAGERRKGDITLLAVLINGGLSSWIAIRALGNKPFEESFHGGRRLLLEVAFSLLELFKKVRQWLY